MGGISEIRYVGYGTPDLDAERKFYGEISISLRKGMMSCMSFVCARPKRNGLI